MAAADDDDIAADGADTDADADADAETDADEPSSSTLLAQRRSSSHFFSRMMSGGFALEIINCKQHAQTTNSNKMCSKRYAVEQLTNFNFFKTLWERRGRAALVCFTSPSCGACRMFKRELPILREFAMKRKLTIGVKLDVFEVDAGENMALTNEHEVVDLPALFLYQNGEFHAPIQAPPDAGCLFSEVEEALKKPPHEAP